MVDVLKKILFVFLLLASPTASSEGVYVPKADLVQAFDLEGYCNAILTAPSEPRTLPEIYRSFQIGFSPELIDGRVKSVDRNVIARKVLASFATQHEFYTKFLNREAQGGLNFCKKGDDLTCLISSDH